MRASWTIGLVIAVCAGCDGTPVTVTDGGVDAGAGDAGGLLVPGRYAFDSRFTPGMSSVGYAGQSARHVLIADLTSFVGSMTAAIDSGTFEPTADGDVVERLDYYFRLPAADRAADPFRLTTDPAPLQSTYGELSGSAFLLEKHSGTHTAADHRNWATEFVGFSAASTLDDAGGDVSNPTGLVDAIFATLEDNALARAAGTPRPSPIDPAQQLPVHVTAEGVDLQQLLQKFLLGAIAFHQAADDYLDDPGLMADNVEPRSTGAPDTALEHGWDEGFGYFGAARDYGDYPLADLAGSVTYRDTNTDSSIDLLTEHNYGASINAAKRDSGSAETARTDFRGQAWSAFRTGRAIITQAGGALSTEQMTALREQRDLAIGAWEAAIAATVVHYINDVLRFMGEYGTPAYTHARFLEHAKAWSELKGFALYFQLNPRSPVSQSQFVMLHQLLGDAPVLPAAGEPAADAYRVALRQARAILGAAFAFDAANLGDDAGEGGW